jgi:hypothetical protein
MKNKDERTFSGGLGKCSQVIQLQKLCCGVQFRRRAQSIMGALSGGMTC